MEKFNEVHDYLVFLSTATKSLGYDEEDLKELSRRLKIEEDLPEYLPFFEEKVNKYMHQILNLFNFTKIDDGNINIDFGLEPYAVSVDSDTLTELEPENEFKPKVALILEKVKVIETRIGSEHLNFFRLGKCLPDLHNILANIHVCHILIEITKSLKKEAKRIIHNNGDRYKLSELFKCSEDKLVAFLPQTKNKLKKSAYLSAVESIKISHIFFSDLPKNEILITNPSCFRLIRYGNIKPIVSIVRPNFATSVIASESDTYPNINYNLNTITDEFVEFGVLDKILLFRITSTDYDRHGYPSVLIHLNDLLKHGPSTTS